VLCHSCVSGYAARCGASARARSSVNPSSTSWRPKAPSTGTCYSHLQPPDAVDAAITEAAQAFTAWRTPGPARGLLASRLGELLVEHKLALASLVTIEAGKISSEAIGAVQEKIDICRFAAGLSRQLYGRTITSEPPPPANRAGIRSVSSESSSLSISPQPQLHGQANLLAQMQVTRSYPGLVGINDVSNDPLPAFVAAVRYCRRRSVAERIASARASSDIGAAKVRWSHRCYAVSIATCGLAGSS